MKNRIVIGISCIILFLLVLISVYRFNKNVQDDLTTIRLAEVTHSSFYTPLYVALENGYFKDEGLKIDLVLTPGADKVSAAVLSGDVQIGFAGAESAIYVYKQDENDYLQIFGGLTKRDGQFIVSRTKIDNFKLEDLIGKEVLGGRPGGMPIINFYNALKNGNIKGVKTNDTVDFANLTSAFLSGTGEFVNLFEPNATKI